MLFSKFQDHTSAVDVWAFGMIMYCVLFGRDPVSFYKVYRQWYIRSHDKDVDLCNLPFIPPSQANFIYDPFSVNFDNPFENVDIDDIVSRQMKKGNE